MFERIDVALERAGIADFSGGLADAGPIVVWELRSMEVEYWGRKRRLPLPGALPAGYLVLSPQGRFVSAIGGSVAGDRENDATFRATFPSAGEYRIENGRFVTRAGQADKVELVQSRDCSVDSRFLEIASSWLVGSRESTEIRRVVFGFGKMS